MSFLVGIVLFIDLCGYLDATLGWSAPVRRRR
jgi:hypothetical protein